MIDKDFNKVAVGAMQGWRQEFSYGGLTLPMRGLNIVFRALQIPNISEKIVFHLPTGG